MPRGVMPRVVPSQVVAFIKALPDYHVGPGGLASMGRVGPAALTCILDLTGEVPAELLTMDSATYDKLVLAKATIRNILQTWIANNSANVHPASFNFGPSDPVASVRDALAKCPDEAPAASTTDLAFVSDYDLRKNLRNDIGAVNRALSNGEWKAATVLAGSVIEALLLWALQQQPTAINDAIATLQASGKLTKTPDANLERWDLHEYTEVASHIGIIEPATATVTRLAREFRNLIHPGRAQRLAQECNRATAYVCVGALEHVMTDLS